jgi:hypothetical protein
MHHLGTWPNKGKMRNCRGLHLILLYSPLSLSLALSIRLLSSFIAFRRVRLFPIRKTPYGVLDRL